MTDERRKVGVALVDAIGVALDAGMAVTNGGGVLDEPCGVGVPPLPLQAVTAVASTHQEKGV